MVSYLFRIFLLIIFLVLGGNAFAGTSYYVRPNGGTNAQCTGLVNADYVSGLGQPCAFKHYYYALGWYQFAISASGGQAGVMVGGDDLFIAPATYTAGPQTGLFGCSAGFGFDCATRPVPSGTSADHTSIVGNGGTPKLNGSGRVSFIFDLRGRNYVDISDIEITDGAECMNGHPTLDCGSVDDAELTVRNGIVWTGSSNINLNNTNIHGLWHSCVYGTSASSSITGNSHLDFCYAGLDMDTCGNNGTCGLSVGQTFSASGVDSAHPISFNWNGCIESVTNIGTPVASGCCNGGSCYGDAFAGSYSSGNWTVNNVEMEHNTSDGLDLRYLKADGSVTVTNSYFGGNGGNQVKVSGGWDLKNNIIEGNCDWFEGKTYKQSSLTTCQSAGDAIYLGLNAGKTNRFYGNSVINVRGNVAITTAGGFLSIASGSPTNYICTSSDNIDIKNSIFSGANRFINGAANGFVYECQTGDFCNDCTAGTQTQTSSNIFGFTSNPTGTGNVFTNPNLSGTFNTSTAAAYLSSTSPARDIADETATGQSSTDINGFDRGSSWDAGALEYGSTPTGSTCGNGFRDPAEQCEGLDLGGNDCTTIGLGFSGGTLACNGTCTFDTSACIGTQPPVCGNSIIEGTEQCDDGNTTNSDCCSAVCETEISGLERLLTYTNTDPAAHLTVTTHKVVVANQDRNSSTTLVKDGGASHFGDFTTKMKVDWTSCVSPNGTCVLGIWALTSTLRSNIVDMETNLDGVYLVLYQSNNLSTPPLSYYWYLVDATVVGGTNIVSLIDTAPPSTRYVKTVRSGSTIIATLYSDSGFTTSIGSLTLISAPTTAYRYFYPVISRNDGFNDAQINATIQNIDIGESTLTCGGTPAASSSGNIKMGSRCGMLGRWNTK